MLNWREEMEKAKRSTKLNGRDELNAEAQEIQNVWRFCFRLKAGIDVC